MTITERLPISVTNACVSAGCLIGSIVAFVTGNWFGGVFLLAIAILFVVIARWARRPAASQRDRVGNFEPRTDADRDMVRTALATVGAVAFALLGLEAIVRIAADDWDGWVGIQVLILTSTWGIAQRTVLDRRLGEEPEE